MIEYLDKSHRERRHAAGRQILHLVKKQPLPTLDKVRGHLVIFVARKCSCILSEFRQDYRVFLFLS